MILVLILLIRIQNSYKTYLQTQHKKVIIQLQSGMIVALTPIALIVLLLREIVNGIQILSMTQITN
jgi:hypothetical protein